MPTTFGFCAAKPYLRVFQKSYIIWNDLNENEF